MTVLLLDKGDTVGYTLAVRQSIGKGGESPFLRVRVPQEMLDSLRELAEKDGRTLSNYVRWVLARPSMSFRTACLDLA